MRPFLALTLSLLVACGGLPPLDEVDRSGAEAPPDELVGPTGGEDPPLVFETPPDWQPSSETWRVDLRTSRAPGLDDALWEDLPDELVIEIQVFDPPVLDVRIASIAAGSSPAEQDWCAPVSRVKDGWADQGGRFGLALGPSEVDLGQDWRWDELVIEGTRMPELGWLDSVVAVGSIPVEDLLDAARTCEDASALRLDCGPCKQLPGDCLALQLTATGVLTSRFVLEPISAGDVALNPDCEPPTP